MSDIFEEVEEEVRKDRLAEIWSRFGWIVWAGALLLVGGVAANEIMSYQREQSQNERSVRFETAIEALNSGDYSTAETALIGIIDEDVDMSAMAAHLLAQLRLDSGGDLEGAGMALADVANAEDGAFEQLALLKSVYLRSETLSLAEIEQELAPLVVLETPIGALAQEMVAAKAFAEGDYERARRDFNRLRFAANAPSGLMQRATIALDAIPRAAPIDEAETNTEPEAEADQNEESP